MATRVKKQAAGSTALTPVVEPVQPIRGSNTPKLVDEKIIFQQVRQALEDDSKADVLAGSATQRMSYAAMAEYDQLIFKSTELGSLGAMAFSKGASEKFYGLIVKEFIGDKPKAGGSDPERNATKKWNKKNQLLTRGIRLASILRSMNVGLDEFNIQLGVWRVPAQRLFPRAFEPTQKDLATRMILLNNDTFGGFWDNDKGERATTAWQASVAQLERIALKSGAPQTRAKRDTGEATVMPDVTKLAATTIASAVGMDVTKAALVLEELFCNADTPDAVVSDFEVNAWNALTNVAKMVDLIMHNTHVKESEAKPATKSGKAA